MERCEDLQGGIPIDVSKIIEEVKREHPSLEKWMEKRILDFFAEIFPEMDNIAEEKNTEIFDAKC